MKRIPYSDKLLEECVEEISKRQRCAHYSMVKGKCSRRWSGRSPSVPCDAWKKRPSNWLNGEVE